MAVVALLAAGCGGDSKAETYEKAEKAIVGPLRDVVNSSSTRVGDARNDRQRSREFAKTRLAVEKAARELDELDPPRSAELEHDNFVIALRRLARDIGAVERAIEKSDRRAARRALTRLRRSSTEVKQANADLNEKVNG